MQDRNLPVCSDRLHSLQMTGIICGASFFSSTSVKDPADMMMDDRFKCRQYGRLSRMTLNGQYTLYCTDYASFRDCHENLNKGRPILW